jgi:hypothetical protein
MLGGGGVTAGWGRGEADLFLEAGSWGDSGEMAGGVCVEPLKETISECWIWSDTKGREQFKVTEFHTLTDDPIKTQGLLLEHQCPIVPWRAQVIIGPRFTISWSIFSSQGLP